MNQLTELKPGEKSQFHRANSQILIVDRAPEELERLFKDFQAEIFTAIDDHEALSLVRKYDFSLAIVKNVSSYELVKRLHEESKNSDLPIIFLSAASADLERLCKQSEIHHLFLPPDFKQLTSLASIFISNRLNEKELLEKNNQLGLINAELESFSYAVSHDLRAPLRAVTGFSNVLVKKAADKLEGDHLRYLNLIINNVDKLNDQIDDLLRLSRLSRQIMHIDQVDLAALSKSVYKELTQSLKGPFPEIKIMELPRLKADFKMMQMMLHQLLDNAVKFSTHNEKSKIEIGWDNNENGNFYYIKDNGIGFEEENAEMLFHLFQKAHSEEEFDGNGVGLAIAKRIINRHNGKIWAESNSGDGATFYFSIPV